MSAPVDVLAVMQYAANETEAMIWRAQNPKIPGVSEPGEGFRHDEIVHRDTQDALAGLIEARAAVAELIEALRLIESAKDRGFGIDYARGVAQAALARCNGGAA